MLCSLVFAERGVSYGRRNYLPIFMSILLEFVNFYVLKKSNIYYDKITALEH